MPPAPRRGGTRGRVRRKARKNIAIGQAHIKTSFNNTLVALTDKDGGVIVWKSAGAVGFKGSRKSTRFAAQVTADAAAGENMKLFLKGERCLTEKCAIERRAYPPGEHGRGRIKQSEYLLQLREKQKMRRYYGVLESQFHSYYAKASRRSGITGENFLRMLE